MSNAVNELELDTGLDKNIQLQSSQHKVEEFKFENLQQSEKCCQSHCKCKDMKKIMACFGLMQVISKLANRIFKDLNLIDGKKSQYSHKRISTLIIFNFLHKSVRKTVFNAIINASKQHQSSTKRQQFKISNEKFSQLQNYSIEKLNSQEFILKYVSQIKQQLNQLSKQGNNQNSKRKYRELVLHNTILTLQKQSNEQYIELCNKRQERENQKKKQSLQMLAQELEQKNQLIEELRKNLKIYIDQSKIQSNILEDDFITYKKEIEGLEKARGRLENQLMRTREELQEKQRQIKQYKQKIHQYAENERKTKKLGAELESKLQMLTKSKQHYDMLCERLKTKIKIFSTHLSNIQKIQTHNQNDQITLRKQIQQTKLSLIFQWMDKIIKQQHTTLQQLEGIFDQSQLELIHKFKKYLEQLSDENKDFHKIDHIRETQFSGIIAKGTHDENQTLFECFDSPRSIPSSQQQRHKKGFTLKLIELQVKINKQVQKISQLKNKIMHIRDIILNFLKILELNADTKAEIVNILKVIIEIFEYSEEEIQNIFTKKKKKFGFI